MPGGRWKIFNVIRPAQYSAQGDDRSVNAHSPRRVSLKPSGTELCGV
jgi:hypothetical protein